MTENLLQKLEEKMMLLLTEVEDARHEIQRLSQENSLLKIEKESNYKKLSDLLSLLDTVGTTTEAVVTSIAAQAMKPVLVQG